MTQRGSDQEILRERSGRRFCPDGGTCLGLQRNKMNTNSYDTFHEINGIFLSVWSLCVADNRKISTQIGLKIIKLIGSSNWKSRNKAVSKVIWIYGFQLCFSQLHPSLYWLRFLLVAKWPQHCIPSGTTLASSHDSSWIPYPFLKQSLWLGDFHGLIGLDLGSCSSEVGKLGGPTCGPVRDEGG